MTEIYVTKYALTRGPFKVLGEVADGGRYAVYRYNGGFQNFFYSRDFHLTKEDAIADCERRRKAKLASLKKQIAKLEKMEFKL